MLFLYGVPGASLMDGLRPCIKDSDGGGGIDAQYIDFLRLVHANSNDSAGRRIFQPCYLRIIALQVCADFFLSRL